MNSLLVSATDKRRSIKIQKRKQYILEWTCSINIFWWNSTGQWRFNAKLFISEKIKSFFLFRKKTQALHRYTSTFDNKKITLPKFAPYIIYRNSIRWGGQIEFCRRLLRDVANIKEWFTERELKACVPPSLCTFVVKGICLGPIFDEAFKACLPSVHIDWLRCI